MKAVEEDVKPKRVAIYTRKSTDNGLEQAFNSLDAQREVCEAYVESQTFQGWRALPNRYDDGGFTGANTDRPAFLRLLRDIEAGQVDIVVVYKVDRLSRSLLDFAKMMDLFDTMGTAFVSVTQNFSTADAMGRLTLNILMSFGEFEREMIRERTRDKIAGARRRGRWTGGVVPYGYEADDGKNLVVVEAQAKVVRAIFDRYLAGDSPMGIARALKEGRLGQGDATEARRWGKATVQRILRNPIYAGWMTHHDHTYEGAHSAIVTRDVFEQAVLRRAQGSPRGGRLSRGKYLLTGRLFCRCGAAMTPIGGRRRSRRDGVVKTYSYYRCVRKDEHGHRVCRENSAASDVLEAFVFERIRDVTQQGGLAEAVADRMKARFDVERAGLLKERGVLVKAVAKRSSESRKLVDTLATIDERARPEVEKRLAELAESRAQDEQRLAEIHARLELFEAQAADAQWVQGVLQNFEAVWAAMSPVNRRRFVHVVVKQIVVDGDDIRITFADLQAEEEVAL